MVSTQEQKWTLFETEKWIRTDRDEWGMLERELHSESAEEKRKTTTSRIEKVGYACINVIRDKLFSV
jgi:hypothetical protein